jgi:prepilin-type N-terminal cleavage/methylation domain-containing protein
MAAMKHRHLLTSPSAQLKGFTLLELITVIALTSISLAAASPWLQQWLWRLQVEAVVQSWSADLQTARLQALRSGQALRIQRLSQCQNLPLANGDWRCGWQIQKVSVNNAPVVLTNALSGEVLVQMSPAQNSLDINASGETVVGGLRVVVQAKHSPAASLGRVICLNIAGRLRVMAGNTCT